VGPELDKIFFLQTLTLVLYMLSIEGIVGPELDKIFSSDAKSIVYLLSPEGNVEPELD
jgi:hypothetical protein